MKKIFKNYKYNNKYNLKYIFYITFIIIIFNIFFIKNNNNYIIKNIFIFINNNIKNKFKLINENIILRNNLNNIKKENLLLKKYKNENKNIKKLLNIKFKSKKFLFSNIINMNDNYLIIDKGKNYINIGDVLINENGILGYIYNVNNDNSKAILITNKNHYIHVKNTRNNISFIIRGDNKKKLIIYNDDLILKDNDLINNDILISSGIDKKFPKNYPVAIIKKIVIKKNRIQDILILPSFLNKNNNFVYIIKN